MNKNTKAMRQSNVFHSFQVIFKLLYSVMPIFVCHTDSRKYLKLIFT